MDIILKRRARWPEFTITAPSAREMDEFLRLCQMGRGNDPSVTFTWAVGIGQNPYARMDAYITHLREIAEAHGHRFIAGED